MGLDRSVGVLKAARAGVDGQVWVDAGRLSVDFVMTGPWPGLGAYGERWEGLHEPADLGDWFASCSLQAHLDVSAAGLERALELRAALWGLTRAATAHGPLPAVAVRTVNRFAAEPPLVPQLEVGGRGWHEPTLRQALSSVARDAVELHADPLQQGRLRECASDDCLRPFYDTSRPGTRRWCDPVRCGDRQRARTYRSHVRPTDT